MPARHALARLLLAVLMPAALPAPAPAGQAEAFAAVCERAVLAGARRGGVPVEVLHAISLTETGRPMGGRLRPWPWAINREGQGHWFGSREEALAFARRSVAEGRHSFDVGCFQINYHWHGRNFASLEAMFDPETGAAYAAGFLRSLRDEFGDWSAAAGAYHSRTPHYARIYRARFDRILAGLGGAALVVAEAAGTEAAGDEPGEDAAPRRSRTRMARGPKIITVAPRAPAAPAGGAPAGATVDASVELAPMGPPFIVLASGARQ